MLASKTAAVPGASTTASSLRARIEERPARRAQQYGARRQSLDSEGDSLSDQRTSVESELTGPALSPPEARRRGTPSSRDSDALSHSGSHGATCRIPGIVETSSPSWRLCHSRLPPSLFKVPRICSMGSTRPRGGCVQIDLIRPAPVLRCSLATTARAGQSGASRHLRRSLVGDGNTRPTGHRDRRLPWQCELRSITAIAPGRLCHRRWLHRLGSGRGNSCVLRVEGGHLSAVHARPGICVVLLAISDSAPRGTASSHCQVPVPVDKYRQHTNPRRSLTPGDILKVVTISKPLHISLCQSLFLLP